MSLKVLYIGASVAGDWMVALALAEMGHTLEKSCATKEGLAEILSSNFDAYVVDEYQGDDREIGFAVAEALCARKKKVVALVDRAPQHALFPVIPKDIFRPAQLLEFLEANGQSAALPS